MADINDISAFLSDFYKGTPIGTPINTVGTSSFGSPGKLYTNSAAPAKEPSFTDLSKGTGWGGILGILGITAADATGNKDIANQIVNTGPDGVSAAVSDTGGQFMEGLNSSLARIAIIILGFIFVAVGLSMFKPGQLITAAAVAPVIPP